MPNSDNAFVTRDEPAKASMNAKEKTASHNGFMALDKVTKAPQKDGIMPN